jgi:hypothetical protein
VAARDPPDRYTARRITSADVITDGDIIHCSPSRRSARMSGLQARLTAGCRLVVPRGRQSCLLVLIMKRPGICVTAGREMRHLAGRTVAELRFRDADGRGILPAGYLTTGSTVSQVRWQEITL